MNGSENSLSLKKAASLFLTDWPSPVITNYHIAVFVFKIYKSRKYQWYSVDIQQNISALCLYESLIDTCIEDGLLKANKFFEPDTVFNIFGRKNPTAEETICTVNPFVYLSHLSAMDFHGLTDRNPITLFLSLPFPAKWRQHVIDLFNKDLDDDYRTYRLEKMPLLARMVPEKINKRSIHYYSSIHIGAYKKIQDRSLRVSKIGRTFLDMLREPKLCGGIEHVIDVYQEHAEKYLNLIVDELNLHGTPIEKVRAGYILDEVCHIQHPVLQDWLNYAQRGGSRKLDPSEEFVPIYSEKWKISINTIRGGIL